MDELEKTINKVLAGNEKFDSAKAQTLRKETIQMFDEKLKKAKLVAWIFLVLGAAMLVIALISLQHQENTRTMIFTAIIALIGYNSTILIKLWYWTVNNRLNILKEIKQLELQIAELTDKKPKPQTS